MRLLRYGCFGLSIAIEASCLASTQYTFLELRLPGQLTQSTSSAADVSDSGWVVGIASLPGRSGYYQWRWKEGTFEVLPEWFGSLGGRAEGVNENGDVCGWEYDGDRYFPVRWLTGQVEQLADLPGMVGGYGNGINIHGDVVGTAWQTTDETHAVRWISGQPVDLGDLPGGPYDAWGNAINDSGNCVGYAHGDSLWSHPSLFVPPLVFDLGTLSEQWDSGYAFDINQVGEVCGASDVDSIHSHWFLWRNEALLDLGPMPGANGGTARSLNDLRQIVGTGDSFPISPLYWTEATGFRQLRPLFPGTWRNINPYGINNKGWIVGEGEKSLGNGQYRWSGFLLKPTETFVAPDLVTVSFGKVSGGSVADLAVKDSSSLRVCKFLVPNMTVSPVTFRVEATLPFDPMNLWLETVSRATVAGAFSVSLNLMDWTTGLYDPASNTTAPLNTSWSTLECIAKGDITRYARTTDRRVWGLIRVKQTGPAATAMWCSEHDLAVFHAVSY